MAATCAWPCAMPIAAPAAATTTTAIRATAPACPIFSTGESQNRTDVRLGWSSARGHWNWAVYANNVFDNQYVGQLNVYGREAFGTVGAVVSEPRTYGMEVGVKF